VPTYTTSILSTADLWSQGTLSKFAGGFDARLGNSLRYDSPVYSGFNYSAQISLRDSSGFPDNTGASANPVATQGANPQVGNPASLTPPNVLNPNLGGDNGDHASELRHAYVFGIAGYYNNGPIQGGIGYERNIKVRNYAVTGGGTANASDWALTVTGAYNFGVIRPALVYERLDYDVPCSSGSASMCSLQRDFWGVSVTAPIGPGALYAFFGDALGGKGSAPEGARVGGLTRGSQTSSQQWEVSYTYPLSKRTQVYAGYVKLQNDQNAAYTFNINSYTIYTGCTVTNSSTCGSNGKPGGLVFGMIHLF